MASLAANYFSFSNAVQKIPSICIRFARYQDLNSKFTPLRLRYFIWAASNRWYRLLQRLLRCYNDGPVWWLIVPWQSVLYDFGWIMKIPASMPSDVHTLLCRGRGTSETVQVFLRYLQINWRKWNLIQFRARHLNDRKRPLQEPEKRSDFARARVWSVGCLIIL